MNVRICSPQLGLSPTSTLGGEMYDYEILKGLARLGAEIEIVLPKNRPYDQSVKNWKVKTLPLSRIPAYLFNVLELPYLFKTYKEKPFSVLRLHAPYFVGIGAYIFRLFHKRVKLVAVYHQARRGFPFDQINKLFIKHWDWIITDSLVARQDLIRRYGVNSQKITAIHNGAPSELKPQAKNKNLIRKLKLEGRVTLLSMGLLTQRKNPLFLIEVIEKLIERGNQVKLIIVGTGPLHGVLEAKIKEHGLEEDVIMLPSVFGPKKQALYSVTDIFVHPALHEGFPLVVLEAMACGLSIVISKGYSASEAVNHGKNGFLAVTNNVNDWVKQLEKLIKNPKKRAQFGVHSRKRVRNEFTWEIAAKKQLTVLKKVASL